MRPTAELVLQALYNLGGKPNVLQTGNTIEEIAKQTGLSRHVVRARLCDLRRLALVESDQCLIPDGDNHDKRYAHYLTVAGLRRINSR